MEALFSDVELRQRLREELLQLMPDFSRLARKLQRGRGSLQDCVRVYQALQLLPTLVSVLEGHSGTHRELLREVFVAPLKVCEECVTK